MEEVENLGMEVVELESIKRELVLSQARLKLTVMAGTTQVSKGENIWHFFDKNALINFASGLKFSRIHLLKRLEKFYLKFFK